MCPEGLEASQCLAAKIDSPQFLTRGYPRPNCLLKCLPNCLGGRFGYFLFFSFSWAGEKGGASEEVAGGAGLLSKIEGGGGLSEEEARERKGRRGNVCGEGGGGAKYFFSGPKCPPSCLSPTRDGIFSVSEMPLL